MTVLPSAGVVIPCYNEADRLDVDRCLDHLDARQDVRLLFADDGSTDATRDLLRSLEESNPDQVAWIGLEENRGKAEAVRRGVLALIESGGCEAIGYWDADLATPLDALDDFRRVLADRPWVDVVLGSRVKLMGRTIVRRAWRHYLGRIFATVASLTLGLPVYDTQCGAKLFRVGEHVDDLFGTPFRTHWIFDVEILARYLVHHRDRSVDEVAAGIYEVPLREWRDVGGSKVGPTDYLVAPAELARIYWTYMREV